MTPTDDTKARLHLVDLAAHGRLDGLHCPQCNQSRVTVRFTNPGLGEYRTWFVCTSCDFRMRTQNSGRPAYFVASRVDPDLERADRE